jgi:hypothetical protein
MLAASGCSDRLVDMGPSGTDAESSDGSDGFDDGSDDSDDSAGPGDTTSATTDDGGTDDTGSAETTGDGDGDGDGGTTGSFDPCVDFELLRIDSVSANSSSGLTWMPGASGEVGATLAVDGTEGFFNYPGIRVSADHPGLTSLTPENWLFGIIPGQPAWLGVSFDAASDIAPGTTVNFTIEATSLEESCGVADTAEIAVVIG